ncbi:trafficking protein particle complex subunit 6B [Thraustotheca clavata]|uniref:Trafficking protein particle complex subunit 6B n=1 Tax=Thraustotheca clavata TaxID=74557 RepID=A0A1V9Z295_9STRA|nr:trafficking protein particle complex subunit 6B [Thraustotheca clavata]
MATHKEVAESSFLQLYGEAVRSMVERYASSTGTTELTDDLTAKLEAFGYDVGYRFVERFSRDRPRLLEPLDIIKFICKDFWIHIFKKQIDKLQTNHRGVFVLQDFNFRWIHSLSADSDDESKKQALIFLIFPCGVLRGALANLGLLAIVNADLNAVPGCVFNIKIR